MNDSSNSQASQIPSDDQMDGLLRDFFASEVPPALNHGFRRPVMQQRKSAELASSLTIVADNDPTFQIQPRGGRLVVGSAIVVLAMSLIMAVTSRPAGLQTGNMATNPSAETTPAPSEVLMLVSPNGDRKDTFHPIGEDGVTLEETDSIELRPKQ